MARFPLDVGDPAPWFPALGSSDDRSVIFDELAGRPILLFFFGSGGAPGVAETLASLDPDETIFDGERALFIGIGGDPDDFRLERLPKRAGQIYLLDPNGDVAARYGLALATTPARAVRPTAFLLSATQRILHVIPFDGAGEFVRQSISLLAQVLARPPGGEHAPILIVPGVFDAAFCQRLIDIYDSDGGRDFGFTKKDGKIERFDPTFRKRLDHYIVDSDALKTCRETLERRLLPMVYRAFQFPTTRIERYLVGCYDAGAGGYFRPHRDNTAPPVAHRRFALSIILNDNFEGGRLRFPEFGDQTYRTDPGDAIVFSCSLLHEVMPVTVGRRYAFITFLYDEQSQRIREAYLKQQT